MEILQNIKSQGELISQILDLKKKIWSGYFGNPKIKKLFEAEISYDFLLYDRLLRKYNCQRRGALYLGGNQGEMLLTLVLLGFKKILVAEPQPELFKQLQQTVVLANQFLSSYDSWIDGEQITFIQAVQCAIGAVNSEAELYITSDSHLTSLFKPIEETINAETTYSDVTVDNKIVVPLKTVDSLIEESSGDVSEFNFLYMNIQGSELAALKGAQQTLPLLDSIYLEQNLIPRYQDCPKPEEIDNYLLNNHFVKAWQYFLPDCGVSYDFYINKKIGNRE